MKIIDTNSWSRKEYFDFFSQFDDPFFGLVSEIDCTSAYHKAKKNNFSFFAYYLYQSLKAVNKIEEFKYRILNNKVVIFDKIHSGSTIGRKDNSFAFSFVEYNNDFDIFNSNLQREIIAVEDSTGLRVNNDGFRKDVIYYSTIPWNKFTSVKHPLNLKVKDSVPKITFGKTIFRENKIFLPISIELHHGFADGYHISKYLELFQNFMNEK